MASKRIIQLDGLPGFLFRRLHQLAVARFTADMSDVGLTPVQWAALVAASQSPGLDQVTLSKAIYIDTSTIAGVLDRLEARGLIQRTPSPDDRRARQLYVTDEGAELLAAAAAAMGGTQEWLLGPLSATERKTFMKLMLKVLERRD
ncbi:MarR family winged helix-turn-helix transcriptional regulator [Variovorax sp. ZT4R33]|uniref:MarR family winged helix-turn-helix transcriptional regulator n=1 Tax=Variovorax sp. ZT4R33 TaxID=3443743 RepID=UPI003F47255B